MESLSQQLRDVNLSDDFYVGSDLSNKANLLEKAKEKIEEQVASSNCGLFIRKRIMCLSVELSVSYSEPIQITHTILLAEMIQTTISC